MREWIEMHSEGNCDLFPFYFFVEPWSKRLEPILGKNIDMLFIVRKGFMKECVIQKQYEEIGRIVFEKIVKKDFFPEIMKNTDLLLARLDKCIKEIEYKDFSNYSSKALADEFNNYCEHIFELNTWGMMITLMEYAKSSYVSNALKNYLEKHFLMQGIDEPVAGLIGLLSTPFETTFLRKQKQEILEIALEFSAKPGLIEMFFEKPVEEILVHMKEFHLQEFKRIEEHWKNFCWIAYGYEGPSLPLEHFVLELKNLFIEGSLEEKLWEVRNEGKNILQKQNELFEFYKIDSFGRNLFSIAKGFMYKKELRKQTLFHAFYAVEGLQKEIAKRLNLSLKQVRYFTREEISANLNSSKAIDLSDTANSRIKLVGYRVLDSNVEILEGIKAENEEKRILPEEIDYSLKEVSGQVAFSGNDKVVSGIARIAMSVAEASKIQEGEILVSYSTNPNMIPFMKKAKAVVTEQGGITCHAAIVSRELKIPCIVGTRIASKIFKNGDRIELDLRKGIVRKG